MSGLIFKSICGYFLIWELTHHFLYATVIINTTVFVILFKVQPAIWMHNLRFKIRYHQQLNSKKERINRYEIKHSIIFFCGRVNPRWWLNKALIQNFPKNSYFLTDLQATFIGNILTKMNIICQLVSYIVSIKILACIYIFHFFVIKRLH